MKIKISVFCWEGCTYSQIGLSKPPLHCVSHPSWSLYWDYSPKEYTKETLTWGVARAWLFRGGDREKYSSDLPLEGRPEPQQVCLPYESWDLSGVGTDSRQRSTRGRPGPQKVCLPIWKLESEWCGYTYEKPRSSKKRGELRVSKNVCS